VGGWRGEARDGAGALGQGIEEPAATSHAHPFTVGLQVLDQFSSTRTGDRIPIRVPLLPTRPISRPEEARLGSTSFQNPRRLSNPENISLSFWNSPFFDRVVFSIALGPAVIDDTPECAHLAPEKRAGPRCKPENRSA